MNKTPSLFLPLLLPIEEDVLSPQVSPLVPASKTTFAGTSGDKNLNNSCTCLRKDEFVPAVPAESHINPFITAATEKRKKRAKTGEKRDFICVEPVVTPRIKDLAGTAGTAGTNSPNATQNRTSSTCTLPATAAERLAREVAGIREVLPDARQVPDGDWRINGELYDHDNAVLLVGNVRGTTTNGYPLTFDAGAAYQGEMCFDGSVKTYKTEATR